MRLNGVTGMNCSIFFEWAAIRVFGKYLANPVAKSESTR